MRLALTFITICLAATGLQRQVFAQVTQPRREFQPGMFRGVEDLPQGRLRQQITGLPVPARERVVSWLGGIHFTVADTATMHVDREGGVYFVDQAPAQVQAAQGSEDFSASSASIPISPFPTSLIFHSKQGAPNVIYLNFSGETVANTVWNDTEGQSSFSAVAFSTDTDYATYNDSEQAAIRRIWQRVAEDYASFDVDVTTERPSSFTTRTAHALITRRTDANGINNPASTAGGVAYVGVFGNSSYARYRPAWIYSDNLSGEESFVAEAVSHEVGHNLGLTHDGKTDGADYYSGHGSGETSWGPVMGTGYNRNVSQWSKGEYYLANNTQDDLATIAGKLTYRGDDHSSSFGSATALSIGAGGSIVSTTPETDPANSSPANKGRIERSTDLDVFSFATGAGQITLNIVPWVVPGGRTRGGNVDLVVELRNSSGQLLLVNNAADRTGAVIQTNVVEGIYYLTVKGTGAGNPSQSAPTGYTSYGSIGQYFISGTVVPSGIVIPPGAELEITGISEPGIGSKRFTVVYSDNSGIDVSMIDSGDVRVTGPSGYNQLATLVAVDFQSNGSPRRATYQVEPPSGTAWNENHGGTYTVTLLPNVVSDIEGAFVPEGVLGTFEVGVPRAIYFANMTTDPGWTFTGSWQYGEPGYVGIGPTGGYTGTNIVAYNLSGNYQNRLSAVHAMTPVIDASGVSSVTMQFRRWLRVRSGDTANIQISTNGNSWVTLWSNTGTQILDSSWQLVQYVLPDPFARSASLRIRWGMASGQNQNDIGWNIDDVILLGNGTLDTTAPTAVLSAPNITSGGAPLYTFNVTYSDESGVSVGSLDFTDLTIVGPNGTNVVEFAGVDVLSDGTPRTALYTLSAPNGTWGAADNGRYEVYLQVGEVTDMAGNGVAAVLLGSFDVAIAVVPPTLNPPSFGGVSINSLTITATTASTAPHVLEASADCVQWSSVATNSPVDGTVNFQLSRSRTNEFYRVSVPR